MGLNLSTVPVDLAIRQCFMGRRPGSNASRDDSGSEGYDSRSAIAITNINLCPSWFCLKFAAPTEAGAIHT